MRMNEADALLPGIHMNRTGQQKTNILIGLFICIGLLTSFCEISFSHPHVFMTQQITSVFDDKGVAGFKIRWEFDDMFSSMYMGSYMGSKLEL